MDISYGASKGITKAKSKPFDRHCHGEGERSEEAPAGRREDRPTTVLIYAEGIEHLTTYGIWNS